MLVWDGAVGFILVEGLFHYFERCEGHLHLWVYFLPSPAPPPRKYLWNKLAFGWQLLLENYKRQGEL